MKKARITLFGWTDYSVATPEQIYSDLNKEVTFLEEAIKRLEELKKTAESESQRLDDPEAIIEYVGYFDTLFSGFIYDLKRVISEMPKGIDKRHVEIINRIFERSVYDEKNCNRDFKREHITMKDIKDGPIKSLLSDIYRESGDQLVRLKNLGSLGTRLETFVGSLIFVEEKKPKAPAVVPFPAPSGITWDKVEIRFLSSKAVELLAGGVREGREFQEIGFADRRGKGYNILWLVLASFAKCSGEICWDTRGLHPEVQANLKSHVGRLGKVLMELFRIKNTRPFEYDRKTKCYIARFKVVLRNDDAYDDIFASFR